MKYDVNSDNHLQIAGCDAILLTAKFKTPLIVYDVSDIRKRFSDLKNTFEKQNINYVISYASKAFSTVAMYQVVKQENCHIDVVSGGELYTAMQANFPMKNISFHGNNKSYDELRLAVKQKVGVIVVDNFVEITMLQEILSDTNESINILLRVTPGITAHTHKYIQTGQADSKFGFDLKSGQAKEALALVLDDKKFNVLGIHAHIGSQIFESGGFINEVTVLIDALNQWRNTLNFNAKVLNIGGGFGIKYTDDDRPTPIEDMLSDVIKTVKEKVSDNNLDMPELWIEPGRFIVGPPGYSLYTVGTIKKVDGLLPYVALDGGMGDNIRPALYQAKYQAILANNPREELKEHVKLVGKYCESGDILIDDQNMPNLKQGQIVALLATGAYGYSMASNYNRNAKPAVLFAENGVAKLVVKRESYEDLVALDVSYE